MVRLEITSDQERRTRFAKVVGHPTRIAILHFLAQPNDCFFGDTFMMASVCLSLPEATLLKMASNRDILWRSNTNNYYFGIYF